MRQVTATSFDKIAPERRERIVWTLAGIGRRIGVGPDFVRDTLANADGSPVREVGGRFFAFEDELIAFMKSDRTKPAKPF